MTASASLYTSLYSWKAIVKPLDDISLPIDVVSEEKKAVGFFCTVPYDPSLQKLDAEKSRWNRQYAREWERVTQTLRVWGRHVGARNRARIRPIRQRVTMSHASIKGYPELSPTFSCSPADGSSKWKTFRLTYRINHSLKN